MAGDLRIRERVVVLPHAAAAASARRAMGGMGRILHRYGSRVMIAALPDGGADSVRSAVMGSLIGSEADELATMDRDGLDPVEQAGLDALALRQSPAYQAAKRSRKHDGKHWDAEGVTPPGGLHVVESGAAPHAVAGAPTSARLTGTVAVGIVIVDGPTANLKFSAAERVKVVAEVQNGLGWLASQSPQGVTFSYDIKTVALNVAPGAGNLSGDQMEVLWRDPTMQKLGYATGMAGVTAYVEDLRSKLGTTWGYCAFFVKYPLGHFAYSSIGGPRLVMDYANDGWGPDNIDRVFAHESGHIFGCPDEYASSNCQCGGSWGYYGKPNGNCENCAPSGGVACLMKQNSWAMCSYTPYHLGFTLVEQRYSGIWRQGGDAHYLWVNASWDNFRAKWEELAKQNLRLVDLEITGAPGQDRFSGVWRQGTGGHYLWVNASWDSFRAKWEDLSKQGLRLVDIDVRVSGSGLRYSGVWLPGNDGHYLLANATWSAFKAKWDELGKQSLRLTDLKIVRVGGDTRYTGVWRQGSGGYYLWVNATWESFQAKWDELAKSNLRLVDLEVTNFDGARRYSGVWLPGTDAHYLWANVDWQSFRAKWEELAKNNLRLVDLEVTTPEDVVDAPQPSQARGALDDRGGMADERAGGATAYVAPSSDADVHGDGGGSLVATSGRMVAEASLADAMDALGFGGGELTPASPPAAEASDGEGGGVIEASATSAVGDGLAGPPTGPLAVPLQGALDGSRPNGRTPPPATGAGLGGGGGGG